MRRAGRAFSGALSLLLAGASGGAWAAEPVARVLELSGDWYLSPGGADDPTQEKLEPWQALPAGGVIRAAKPTASDSYIRIVDPRGEPVLEERTCGNVVDCMRPLYLPKAREATDGNDATSLFEPVWEMLWGEPYRFSLHRTRGPGMILAEGVAALADGRIDLAASMRDAPAGTYELAFSQGAAGSGATQPPVEFGWEPAAPGPVEVGERTPGLYEISMIEPAEENSPVAGVSIGVLLCPPAECAPAAAALESARAVTGGWGDAASPATVHAFLRAVLANFADPAPVRP